MDFYLQSELNKIDWTKVRTQIFHLKQHFGKQTKMHVYNIYTELAFTH